MLSCVEHEKKFYKLRACTDKRFTAKFLKQNLDCFVKVYVLVCKVERINL